jgi:hypothetical protein
MMMMMLLLFLLLMMMIPSDHLFFLLMRSFLCCMCCSSSKATKNDAEGPNSRSVVIPVFMIMFDPELLEVPRFVLLAASLILPQCCCPRSFHLDASIAHTLTERQIFL